MDPSSHVPEGFSELDVFALGSCLLVEGLLGFFMNAVTMIAFLTIRDVRTPSNFLVFSLALADMGISTNATIAAFSSFLRADEKCNAFILQYSLIFELQPSQFPSEQAKVAFRMYVVHTMQCDSTSSLSMLP
ncbi:RPE-retinal G protein-coupled receptor-like [Clarias magur]|uniref:RPE-retinal G protein-coupled receptor-like n=1 Tax=Clarias magur TaxID=1594786 RepID=A0A8J5C9D0_CLAMG|nr:RPE-retinal G protein-coupled receptor-like [Clarias magur]